MQDEVVKSAAAMSRARIPRWYDAISLRSLKEFPWSFTCFQGLMCIGPVETGTWWGPFIAISFFFSREGLPRISVPTAEIS